MNKHTDVSELLNVHDRNTAFELVDKNGNVKKLFTENKLGTFLLQFFRRLNPNPIENGQVKPGLMNYLSAYGLQIPFITGSFGSFKFEHNLITNVGHAGANGRMSNQGGYSAFTALAIGTGTTAAAAADTALQTEITTNGGGRGAATASQVTTSVSNDTTQLVKTWNFTGSFAVTEEGILDNASSGGNLLAHQVFSAINVVNGDSLQVTHKYQT